MARPNFIADYIEAYEARHGETPLIEQVGDRFAITTRTGYDDGYTAKDVRNLTRGLRALAGR